MLAIPTISTALPTTYNDIGPQLSNDRGFALHPLPHIAVDILLVLKLLLVVLRPLLGRIIVIRDHRVPVPEVFLQELVDIVLAYERRIGVRSHKTSTISVEVDRLERLDRLCRVSLAVRRRSDSRLVIEKGRRGSAVVLVHGTLEVKRVGRMRVTRSFGRVWHVVSGRGHRSGTSVTLRIQHTASSGTFVRPGSITVQELLSAGDQVARKSAQAKMGDDTRTGLK